MRARRLIAAALAATTAFLAACGAPARDTPVVWVLGDSLTTRTARQLALLRPDWTVRDLGVGGERSDATRARLARLLADEPPPSVAVVVTGTNDVVAGRLEGVPGYDPWRAAANVARMVAALRTAGVVPIVALPVGAPPPAPGDSPDGRRRLRALRRGLRDLRAALRGFAPRVDLRLTEPALFQDALHPTPDGGAVLARRVARAVERTREGADGGR